MDACHVGVKMVRKWWYHQKKRDLRGTINRVRRECNWGMDRMESKHQVHHCCVAGETVDQKLNY